MLTLPGVSIFDAQHILDAGLAEISKKASFTTQESADGSFIEKLQKELDQFFFGQPTVFTVPVDWSYYTPFQRKVLSVVKQIPWGELKSYGEIASIIGQPQAARAVGGALGSNRVLLVIPCHRVIRQDGSPGGFGSGLRWKYRLLELEGITL